MKVNIILIISTLGIFCQGYEREIFNQIECRQDCIDRNYEFFSDTLFKGGMCCDSRTADDPDNECFQGGITSQRGDQMKYFACPTGTFCGPLHILAHSRSLTYNVNTASLVAEQNMCNHQFTFDINAGVGDILTMKFNEAVPGTKVHFSVGNSFDTSRGETIEDLTESDVILKIGFPNKLYITVEHPVEI